MTTTSHRRVRVYHTWEPNRLDPDLTVPATLWIIPATHPTRSKEDVHA